MKKLIAFWLILINSSLVFAQFKVVPVTTQPGRYKVEVDPAYIPQPGENQPRFDKGDLITWIFPDGQFTQVTIILDGNNAVDKQTNEIFWIPLFNLPNPSHTDIYAYVAKKGGQGNPGLYAQTPIGTTGSSTQINFNMPSSAYLQMNTTWDFSKGWKNFLVTSYRFNPDLNCMINDMDFIEIYYNPLQLIVNPTEDLRYRGENIASNVPGYIKISNFTSSAYNTIPNHVFNSFTVTNNVQEGDNINITVKRDLCGKQETTNLSYVAKGEPHDPNQKTVDIDTICPNQAPIKLTYTIRVHNDGDEVVNKMVVTDNLPFQLNASTLVPPPAILPGGVTCATVQTGQKLEFTFNGLNLPGIRQTTPTSYIFDQTVYSFSFTVNTVPNFNMNFDNWAEVVFYDNQNPQNPLPPVLTNVAHVVSDSLPLPDCTVPVFDLQNLVNITKIIPNPISAYTNIVIDLGEKSKMDVDLIDLNGSTIRSLGAGEFLAGSHQFTWDDVTVPPGVYILRVSTPRGNLARKIVKI